MKAIKLKKYRSTKCQLSMAYDTTNVDSILPNHVQLHYHNLFRASSAPHPSVYVYPIFILFHFTYDVNTLCDLIPDVFAWNSKLFINRLHINNLDLLFLYLLFWQKLLKFWRTYCIYVGIPTYVPLCIVCSYVATG